jgi:hypothetical protein
MPPSSFYGQLAVFTRDEARGLLAQIASSLRPGGRLLVELLDQDRVPKTSSSWWYTRDEGLWADAPFLHLGERLWLADERLSLERFYTIRLDSGELTEVTLCDQTYALDEMVELMTAAGFTTVQPYRAWDRLPLHDAQEWVVFVARKGSEPGQTPNSVEALA